MTRTASITRFRNRRDAGRALAVRLASLGSEHPVVLALPRGGVPVASEVARALHAPLDVMVVRKLGVPTHPELGMGAIGEGGVRILDADLVRRAGVTSAEVEAVTAREQAELARRVRRYRGGRPMMPLRDRTVVIVDDGIATGGTARAAVSIARHAGARRVVLAVPVAAPDTAAALGALADEVIALATPTNLVAVGAWYDEFSQTTDDDVVTLLAEHHMAEHHMAEQHMDEHPQPETRLAAGVDVVVAPERIAAPGRLVVPTDARGLVVFAHGTGSSRTSPRNRFVAQRLEEAGLATLLFDLLSGEEALDRTNVFDIELLAVRLLVATRWARHHPACAGLDVGYFGASTGAGAALLAASEDPTIAAVVSRGGRPDLAADRLTAVSAPTLLIVGGADPTVRAINENATRRLRCEHRLVIVPGATHLFEEPGALEAVADHAATWFTDHLGDAPRSTGGPRP
jgi:putative phosphoribosyl transferase